MAVETEKVILQNETGSPITFAVVVLSQNLNGTSSRNVVPLYNAADVSTGNPLPPNQQAERDVANLDRRYRYAKLRYRVGTGPEFTAGPYTTPGTNHFIQQVRFAVRRADGRYVQVQIEDQLPFSLLADEKAEEFDDQPAES